MEACAAHEAVDGVLVVTGPGDVARCREALDGVGKVLGIVSGGESRQESVMIGLYSLGGDADNLIMVHDGARPLLTPSVMDRCLVGARQQGNAVAALPVVDTLKSVNAHQIITGTTDRTGLWAMQTPQCFRLATLFRAHSAARRAGFLGTDEASLVEQFGDEPVHLVLGAADNLKITRAEDLALAEAILRARHPRPVSQTRVGFGYDIHRLVPGRRLVLGGVEIADPEGRGLDGHSDADVLLHALMDALLGAAGMPDIGHLFPNTDPAYAGADSTRLLAEVVGRVHAAGYVVVNVDITVIAEAPRLAPHINRMRAVIAEHLQTEPAQVGIKATTNEGLGALGAGQGIAAHAVANLARP